MSDEKTPMRRLRSQDWFDNPDHLDMTALYLERFGGLELCIVI